jgi:putative transposase
MVQFDVCEGAWLKGYRRVYLIAFMDAYSRYIVGWQWVETNSSWNNIQVLRAVACKYGLPELFYTDNASFYKVIRHDRSIYQKHKPMDEHETTMQRIILDLGSIMVNHKPYEPQGKGRIERFFRFMQDRFIAEHKAKNLTELNSQFKIWIKWYNSKHSIRTIGCVPKDRFNTKGFKPVPKDLNLEKVFSYHFSRKVDKYNSFSFEGNDYRIDPENCKHFSGCLSACTIQIYVSQNTILAYHQNIKIQEFKRATKKQL